jgi:hypothetical protein
LATYPTLRRTINGWLKAGVLADGTWQPTERGSPQGGVISPVLMNVALHGMEQAAGVRYIPSGSNAGTARPGSPVLVRYADDMLALCHSREQAEQVKARLAEWLATVAAFVAILILGIVVWSVAKRGASELSWTFLTSDLPTRTRSPSGGIGPAVVGTVMK